MPRLFSALRIPATLAERLTSFRGGLPGARWIDPCDYHVTLRFFGDIDHAAARDLDDELRRIVRRPFTATIAGLDAFGSDKPRALIARLRAEPELSALQADHERAARIVGLCPETRKFTPHVTLARLKTSSSAVAFYLQSLDFGAPGAFRVDRVFLFSSRASAGGGPYIAEAEYPFEAEPEKGLADGRRKDL